MQSKSLRRMLALGAVTAAVTTTSALATATPVYADTSSVTVVHAIPETPVDVYVNGEITLKDFQPGKIAGPLNLPEGTYDIDITKPGEPITSAILTADDAAVPGGANISIVAHLDEAGQPKITPFVNDTSAVQAGKARLIVRHTAAAPAVDVRASGTPVFSGLTNPDEAKADLPAGTVSADVVLAGTDTVAIPATDLTLAEGTVTIVYATGSAQAKTLGLLAQVITGAYSAPDGVPGGDGGSATDSGPALPAAVAALGVLLLLAAGTKLATGTNRR